MREKIALFLFRFCFCCSFFSNFVPRVLHLPAPKEAREEIYKSSLALWDGKMKDPGDEIFFSTSLPGLFSAEERAEKSPGNEVGFFFSVLFAQVTTKYNAHFNENHRL